MDRFKDFDATGVAPNGRLYAGDLNLMQDLVAALSDFAQTIDANVLRVGDSSLSLSKFGTGELWFSNMLRVTGILRGLGGLVAGTYTTAARNSIPAGSRPYGLLILNTDTNRYEQNLGTDAVPDWQGVGRGIANADVAAAAAIARSKLDFGAGLVNSDIAAAAGIVESKLNLTHYLLNRVVTLTSASVSPFACLGKALFVECFASGGGGGGCAATGAGQVGAGGGGGSGGYSCAFLTANLIGNLVFTINAAGAGVSGADGADGGSTEFQNNLGTVVCKANGGKGGKAAVVTPPLVGGDGGLGGVLIGAVGDLTLGGQPGEAGMALQAVANGFLGGRGGGLGGPSTKNSGAGTSAQASGGGGGGGAARGPSSSAVAGGNGGSGMIRIWEFL